MVKYLAAKQARLDLQQFCLLGTVNLLNLPLEIVRFMLGRHLKQYAFVGVRNRVRPS